MASAGQSDRIQALRTREDQFRDLLDYPFAPNWTELADGLRVHHVDEGPPAIEPVLTANAGCPEQHCSGRFRPASRTANDNGGATPVNGRRRSVVAG